MPILGFGVYQIPANETKRCVLNVIKVRNRNINKDCCNDKKNW